MHEACIAIERFKLQQYVGLLDVCFTNGLIKISWIYLPGLTTYSPVKTDYRFFST
jgi:hypothetical protein